MTFEEWMDEKTSPTVNTMKQMENRIRESKPHLPHAIRCRVVLGSNATLIVPVNFVKNFANIRGVNVQGDFLIDSDPVNNAIWVQPSGLFTLSEHDSDI